MSAEMNNVVELKGAPAGPIPKLDQSTSAGHLRDRFREATALRLYRDMDATGKIAPNVVGRET